MRKFIEKILTEFLLIHKEKTKSVGFKLSTLDIFATVLFCLDKQRVLLKDNSFFIKSLGFYKLNLEFYIF